LLTSQGLSKIKSKARKRGIWYEALTKTERCIIDLTIRCVEKVRSPILAKALSRIIDKITKTLEEGFMSKAQNIGNNLAKQIAYIARKWGNQKSPDWEHDSKFIKFLGVIALNT
jgi:hypothetical protein